MASTRLIAALLAGASLAAGCSSSSEPAPTPPVTFTTADLAGTWRFAIVLEGVTVATANTIGWRRGEATIDTSGVVTYGSVLDSLGTTTPPAATNLSVDANGVVIGTLANVTEFNGQLSRGKDLIIATSSQSGPSVALRVWQKVPAGTTYSAADLPGTWSYHQVLTGSADGWERGVATVNALGGLALSGRADMGGALADVPAAGTLSIDANGWVALDSNPSWLAFMSPDKSRLVALETTDAAAKAYGLNVIVRTGHAFAQSDAGGSYAFRGLDSSSTGGLWLRGHLTVTSAGSTSVTDQLDSAGDTSVPPPFGLTLGTDGTATITGLPGIDFHGTLGADGQLLAATQSFGAGEGGLLLVLRR
jgi:hypothetical protein